MKIIAYIALFATLSACSARHDADPDKIALALPDNSACMLDIFTDKEWLQLSDSSTEAVIPSPSRIIADNGIFYILDPRQKCIKTFDSSGAYRGKIGNFGNGPGEYGNIVDFTINPDSGQIIVLSEPAAAHIYDLDGSFILSKPLYDTSLRQIVHVSDGYVATTDHSFYPDDDSAYLIYVFDNDLNFKSKHIPARDRNVIRPEAPSRTLKSFGDKAVYLDLCSAEVYRYDSRDSSVSLLMTLDLPDMMPAEFNRDFDLFFDNMSNHSWIKDFIADDSRLIVNYIVNGTACFARLSYDGEIIQSAQCDGWLPTAWSDGSDNTYIPLSTDDFFAFIADTPAEFKPDREGNMILLKGKIAHH